MRTTLPETLTRLAQSIESLQPVGAAPAWAEILGPLESPDRLRWHAETEALVGFVAPPDCQAVVAVAYGWARSLGPATGYRARENPDGCPLLRPGERKRCRVVCIMARSGDTAGYMRTGTTILIDTPPIVGRIPDLMRRCFGLPTPPPEEPTDRFLASMWLSNVLDRADAVAPRALAWPEVANQHPALMVATEAGLTVPPGQIVSILRAAADVWTWGHLARQAATPGHLADLLPEGGAQWMDEGILARWLLGTIAGVEDLLPLVTAMITPAAAKKLRTVLCQLGCLDAGAPG